MNWIKVKIGTTAEGIDPVSGRLLELGISGIEIADKVDFQEFLENNRKYWDYVDEELERLKEAETEITLYVSDEAAGLEQLSAVRSSMEELRKLDEEGRYGSLRISTDHVKDEDWSEIWKQYFHPIPVGKKVLIQPQWEPVAEGTDRTVFVVNPGMSFGSGSHPSTRFCIEEIEKYLRPEDHVLDLGCGSGILSIIALLLGAEDAVAIDIDANAVDVAYTNLALNHISKEKYHAFAGDILTDEQLQASLGQFDLVIANIVADVIIGLAGFVRKFMKEGAYFICSGIINERLEEVKNALINGGFEIVDVRTETDWAAITAR